ncbi:MAG: hypothetical protein IIZ39_04420, partial [Blautia sp.]|nr:hypothetical protein [Blautia sp.]
IETRQKKKETRQKKKKRDRKKRNETEKKEIRNETEKRAERGASSSLLSYNLAIYKMSSLYLNTPFLTHLS